MDEKGTSTRRLDCSYLLQNVHRIESQLPESSDAYFGHPSPPKVSLLDLDGILLMVGQTKRGVSAQICVGTQTGKPEEIFCLPPKGEATPEDETITTLTMVTLKNSNHVAVVIGTSCSRVLSVELKIHTDSSTATGAYERISSSFEPLPLDTLQMSQEQSLHSENLNRSRHGPKIEKPAANKNSASFGPIGGVNNIEHYTLEQESFVWVSYKDGTLMRLPSESFFPSIIYDNEVWKEYTDKLIWAQVMLPPTLLGGADVFVMALPKYHPSPLAPLTPWKPEDFDIVEPSLLTSDDEDDSVPEFHEALSFCGGAATGLGDLAPTISFYTSEDQFLGRITGDFDESKNQTSNEESVLFESAIEATTALVGGVFGAAFGVVKWSFGGRGRKEILPLGNIKANISKDVVVHQQSDSHAHFSTLHTGPCKLYPGYELHDAPRLVTSVSIDPNGNLAATTDTLGRVVLIDLATKQVVRIWKGVRDASCCWMEGKTSTGKGILYIVIHSRQRQTVDVWKMRHGGQVLAMQVGRDAQLVRYKTRDSVNCMLLQSAIPGSSINQLDFLLSKRNKVADPGRKKFVDKFRTSNVSIQAAALRMQTLQQLLANTNVPCQAQDVFEALTQVTTLKDLCLALDLLSVSSTLEERMQVKGTEFQRLALTHCKQQLDNARKSNGLDHDTPQIQVLSSSIKFHSQLADAYDVLYAFEDEDVEKADDENECVSPRSAWSVEALSWMTTAETVSGVYLDNSVIQKKRAVALFSSFTSSCCHLDQIKDTKQMISRFKIYFCDSSRTRKEILIHIFKPLLKDIFSFSVTNTVLEYLGLRDDIDYLQKCFGEWFMSIPAKESANKAFFELYSPMARWLQEIAGRQIEIQVTNDSEKSFIVLGSLHKFCTSSEDLVRTFTLSSLCREAVFIVAQKKEVKTFGKIWRDESVQPWESLLRKLRVCLFVSLRLFGLNLGSFPVTVEHVDSNDIFSIYEWLARDELISGHKHDSIISLEMACKGSGMVFDPSTSIGDNPSKWKLLQLACLANAISEEERSEYLVDFDDEVQGALLLYISSHNNPSLLVAHRALLLAGKWSNDPSNLELLYACAEALTNMNEDASYKAIAGAVRLEVWQTCIRPFFRALFFGFHDVHNLLEESIGPLFLDRDWLRSFGEISLELLSLLYRSCWGDSRILKIQADAYVESSGTWPPVKEDIILKRLVESTRGPDSSALDLHRAIVCGFMVSENYESLAVCINGFYDAFLPSSISDPSTCSGGDAEMQIDFLEQASISQASRLTKEAVLDHFDLGEIETLAQLWGIEVRDVRTIFLLAMYELGYDTVVDTLVTKSAQKIDLSRFVEDGLGIVCRRLNRVLNVNRSPQVRKIMGLLDADTCEWLREHAELSVSLIDEGTDASGEIPLKITHQFTLRILGFSSAMGAKTLSAKIHSLSILCGTLMKALEALDS